MKAALTIFIVLLIVFIPSIMTSQSNEFYEYYPLNIGDIKYYSSAPTIVIEKTIIEEKEYTRTIDYRYLNNYERIDLAANVYAKRSGFDEELYIKLNAAVGEKWNTKISGRDVVVTLESINDTVKTENETYYNCKHYSFYYKVVVDANYEIWLAKGVGLVKSHSIDWGTTSYFIKGIIGGKRIPSPVIYNTFTYSIPKNNTVDFPVDGGMRLLPKFLIRNEFINPKYFSFESKKQGKLQFTFPSFYDTIKSYYYLDFIIQSNFEYEDEIKLVVSKEVEDLIGDRLFVDYTLTFKTEKKVTTPNIFVKDTINKLGSGFIGYCDAADFNGDEKFDYIFSSDTLSGIFKSNASNFVTTNYTQSLYNAIAIRENVHFVDYNNDGCLDASLAARLNNVTPSKHIIQLYANKDNELVADSVLNIQAFWMAWHDFTKDGLKDIIVMNTEIPYRHITIYKNEKGSFSKYLSYLIPDNSNGPIALLDIDGDSEKEIIKSHPISTFVLALRNDALVNLNYKFPFFENMSSYWGMDSGDIDKDGVNELIVGSYLCRRNGTEFVIDNTVNKLTDAYPKFYDYDKDGYLDLFMLGNRIDAAGREYTYAQIYKNYNGMLKLLFEQKLKDKAYFWAKFDDLNKDGMLDFMIYNSGIQIYYNNSFSTNIISNKREVPNSFFLSQNYPNPFNPETTIQYTIPAVDAKFASATHVTLKVFDVLGREVASLVDEYKNAGNYKVTFNVKTLRATSLPSGIYFYRLKAGSFVQTKKMLLLK